MKLAKDKIIAFSPFLLVCVVILGCFIFKGIISVSKLNTFTLEIATGSSLFGILLAYVYTLRITGRSNLERFSEFLICVCMIIAVRGAFSSVEREANLSNLIICVIAGSAAFQITLTFISDDEKKSVENLPDRN